MKQALPVWDALVRIAHWSLLVAIALAWLSGEVFGWFAIHQPAGYAAIAIVSVRVIWGFIGTRFARFTQFIHGPASVWRYAHAVLHGKAPRYVGHNPLGGWMVIALMCSVMLTVVTGWLFTTDRFWGDPVVHLLHEVFAWSILVLAALHVAGVMYTSRAHHENLIGAMITGRKSAPQGDDHV
jgi:cytochrome b